MRLTTWTRWLERFPCPGLWPGGPAQVRLDASACIVVRLAQWSDLCTLGFGPRLDRIKRSATHRSLGPKLSRGAENPQPRKRGRCAVCAMVVARAACCAGGQVVMAVHP